MQACAAVAAAWGCQPPAVRQQIKLRGAIKRLQRLIHATLGDADLFTKLRGALMHVTGTVVVSLTPPGKYRIHLAVRSSVEIGETIVLTLCSW